MPMRRPAATSSRSSDVPREQTNRYGILDVSSDDGRLASVRKGWSRSPRRPRRRRPCRSSAATSCRRTIFGHLENTEQRRRQRDPADRRHGQADRRPSRSTGCASKARATIAATRSASSKRTSPSASRDRTSRPTCAASSRRSPEPIPYRSQESARDERTVSIRRSCANTTSAASSGDAVRGRGRARHRPRLSARSWPRAAASASRSAMTAACPRPMLEEALVEGLTEAGDRRGARRARPDADAVLRRQRDARASTAASWSPARTTRPTYNGFKMMLGGKSFFGEDIQKLGAMAPGRLGDRPRARRRRAARVFDEYVARLAKDYDGADAT